MVAPARKILSCQKTAYAVFFFVRKFVYTREACPTLMTRTRSPPQVRNFLTQRVKKWIAFLLPAAQKEQKAVLHDNVYTKIVNYALYCSKNKSLYAIMCTHICIYTRKEKNYENTE